MPFDARFPVANKKLQKDAQLVRNETTAAASRPRPPFAVTDPNRTLINRFAHWLSGNDAGRRLMELDLDEQFFQEHKHLGERADKIETVAVLYPKNRFRDKLIRSRDKTARQNTGELTPRFENNIVKLVDELIGTTADRCRQRELLNALEKHNINLESPYAFATPISADDTKRASAFPEKVATTWPCRLGLDIGGRQLPYIILITQGARLDPAMPTGFDAGMLHLCGTWRPGGVTNPGKSKCSKPECKLGLPEVYLLSPALTDIQSVGSFVTCADHAVSR